MNLLRFILLLLYAPLCLHAGDLERQRLEWQLRTGDVRNIAGLSRQYVQKKLGAVNAGSMGTLLEDKELAQACYMAHFFASVGKEKNASLHELKDQKFCSWLMENPKIFEKLFFSKASGRETLAVLHSIWIKENGLLSGMYLNMALGAALVSTSREPEACLARYDFYKKSFEEKKLFPQFDTLEPWEIHILFQGRESLEELAWAQEYVSQKKRFKADNAGNVACSFIPYRMTNKKGISIHAGGPFYDNKPISLQIYVEYGGVCGAVSKGSVGFLKAKGIPGYAIGQPGHCAFVWKQAPHKWVIGNNIYGWTWSEGGKGPWKGCTSIIREVARFEEGQNASRSALCHHLGLLSPDPQQADSLLQEALKLNPANYPVWQVLAKKVSRKTGNSEKLALLEKFKEAFPDNAALWEHFMKSQLGIDWKKTDAYATYPFLLNSNESRDAVDVYMRNFSAQACKDIPAMSGKLPYETKTRGVFFKNWLTYYQENKIDRKVRVQTCAVLEKALPGLLKYEKTASQFLDFYGKALELWNDKNLLSRANAFLTAYLDKADNPEVKKKLAATGAKVADLLKDRKSLLRYSEAM